MKKILIVVVILLIGLGSYFAWIKFSPNKFTDVYYLVPDDAVMVMETDKPIENWQYFSTSNMWLGLKSYPPFAEITKNADLLDDVIKSNQQVFSLLGQRHLLISIHMTKTKDYDFVYYTDMQEASKSSMIKTSLISVIKQFDYKYTFREYNEVEIHEFLDPQSRDVLSVCFVNNYLVCSYNKSLIENVILTSKLPEKQMGVKPQFTEVNRLTGASGICRLMINYNTFHQYLGVYMDDVSDLKSMFGGMFYSGMEMSFNDDVIQADGYTLLNDTVSSYLKALSISGKSKTGMEGLFSEKTSFLLGLGFADFSVFYENLNKVLQKDAEAYETQQAAIKKVEKLLNINLQKDLFDWMGSEIGIAQYETDVLIGNKVKNVLAIKVKNKDQAIAGLERIEKQVRKRTPIKFKEVSYKNYPIKYLEIKGLFKAVLGKMFSKIEKPYYTIIDDYVVMSDDPKTLLITIDDFIEQKTLKNAEVFRDFRSKLPEQISVLAYVSPNRHFANFKGVLSPESWASSKKNQMYIRSFNQVALSLTGDADKMRTVLVSEYMKWEEPEVQAPTVYDDSLNMLEEGDTLNSLDLFIVLNFNQNLNNTYYENGQVKTSVEMEGKMMDGSYIEYYENGVIKVKGQYKKGVKHGTWKFYSPAGILESKQKMQTSDGEKKTFWEKLFG
ncbi:MAG: DUF3352 domain-containing protein [Bacteroidota bacterium]|nr:DUF3352 domain-containing protein [Bacteroidota bacterium]